jgi:hypothetical protein
MPDWTKCTATSDKTDSTGQVSDAAQHEQATRPPAAA